MPSSSPSAQVSTVAWSKPSCGEPRLQRAAGGVGIGAGRDHRLERDHRPGLGDRPGVQVADGDHLGDGVAQVGGDARRRRSRPGVPSSRMWALSRTTRQAERRIRAATKTERIGSIGVQPVPRMTSAATMAPAEPSRSPSDVQQRGAQVEVAAVAARQHPEAREVDEEAGGRDGEHQAALDRARVGEPLDRLDDDPGGDREEREAVDEGGEHREPVEAVGAARVGRAAGDAEGEPGHRQRGEVGQHVPGVGDQRQRAGEEAAGDLDQHEAAGQERGDADRAGAGLAWRGGGRGRGLVVVVVAHRRAIASATRAVKSCGSRTASTSAASTVTPQRSAIAA